MRLFLDANVLFSAAKSDGAVRALLRLLQAQGRECWADAYVVAEARRNLETKGAEALAVLEALLGHIRIAQTTPRASVAVHRELAAWLPEKDQPVLLAAMRLRCDALVTGDRTHFGVGFGRTLAGVTVHSSRSLAQQALG